LRRSRYAWCMANPAVMKSILAYAACSAAGQSFIFYTISVFDPLVCPASALALVLTQRRHHLLAPGVV
jgi:hypothetical protein